MKWLKLYTEARIDNKLRTLTDEQFRIWFNLLCLASEQPERGTIHEYDQHVLAVEVANGDCNAMIETCNALQALRCVTCNISDVTKTVTVTFPKFQTRQQTKPSSDKEKVAERVRKHRNKKKLHDGGDPPPDPKRNGVTPCNAVKRRETPIDGDGEEKRINPPSPPGGEMVAGKIGPTPEKSSRPLRSQANFNPTPEDVGKLKAWAKRTIGERFDSEYLAGKIDGYTVSYPLDWLEDAILVAKVNARPGQFDQYFNGVLCRWHTAGQPSHAEVNAAKLGHREATLPASRTPTKVTVAPPGFSRESKRKA